MNVRSLPPTDSKLSQCGGLLLALMPLFMVAAALVWRVPSVSDVQRVFEGPEPYVYWSTGRAGKYWCLNALTGEVTQKHRFEIDAVGLPLSDGDRVFLETRRYVPGRCEGVATIVDSQTHEVRREISFDLPAFPTILDGRYAVCMDASQISVLDLYDAEPKPFHLAAPLVGRWTWISQVPGKSRFWRINDSVTKAAARVEVFEIADHSVQKLFSWPVGTLGHRAGQADDCLWCVTPDDQRIQRRSLDNGKVVETIALPPGFDPTTMTLGFMQGLFWTSDGVTNPKYYDPTDSRQLQLPDDRLHLASSSPDGRRRLFFDYPAPSVSRRAVIYDMASHTVRLDLPLPQACYVAQFLPDNRLKLASSSYGISSYLIDLDSGQITHRQTPYAWVAYAMPLLFLSFLVWAIAWMRASARAGIWAWCDIALLSGIVMLPLLLRLFAVGTSYDVNRLPFNYCHGIFLGLFQLGAAWLIFGAARLTLRYIPIVLILAALVTALNFVLTTNKSTAGVAVEALALTVIPALAMCALSGLARLGGWRWRRLDQGGPLSVAFTGRTTMRDPFIAITCFAIAAAAMRPLAPYLFHSQMNGFQLDILAMLVACTFAALMFALTARRLVFKFGAVISILLSVAIVAQPTYDFVAGRQIGLPPSNPMVHFRVIATATLATYIFALAYRCRGWRFGRAAARFSPAISVPSASSAVKN